MDTIGRDTYLSFVEYMQTVSNAVLLFILCDVRGVEMERQVRTLDDISIDSLNSCSAKFVVDESLTTKMIPGNYTLYMYVGVPKSTATSPYSASDYTLDKCLTEQGIKIRVRGGLNEPSVGTD